MDSGSNETEAGHFLRVHEDPADLSLDAWNRLLAQPVYPTPFVWLDHLRALHGSGSVPMTMMRS